MEHEKKMFSMIVHEILYMKILIGVSPKALINISHPNQIFKLTVYILAVTI